MALPYETTGSLDPAKIYHYTFTPAWLVSLTVKRTYALTLYTGCGPR